MKNSRSSIHNVPAVSDRIVAARGQLYIRAKSPNDEPASKVPSDSPAIVISQRPVQGKDKG